MNINEPKINKNNNIVNQSPKAQIESGDSSATDKNEIDNDGAYGLYLD